MRTAHREQMLAWDAERMGALAVYVAELVRRRLPQHVLSGDVDGCFAEMAQWLSPWASRRRGAADQRSVTRRAAADDDDAMESLHR
ncbi:hypothetical protein [Mycolicibacterium hodleri]|nr:hypothetical protein [Mycolicibacterium hodleri]